MFRFTRFGTFYILFSIAVGAAAINTGNNLLYLMLGLLLGFIIVSGFLSDSSLWGLRAHFEPAGDLYAGQPAEWDLRLHKGWFPAILVKTTAHWEFSSPGTPPYATAQSEHLSFWIPRYGQEHARVTLTPRQRGRVHLNSIHYSTRFPFGLFEKTHRWRDDQSWIVLPRVRVLPMEVLQLAGMDLLDQPSAQKGVGTTPFDIRPYLPGDPRKRIHWKSSAKRGTLMVADMEEESDMTLQVVVTHWPPPGERLEEFISFVASLIFTLYREGRGVGLLTPGAHFPGDASRTHLKNVLTYLALVDPSLHPTTAIPTSDRWIDALALWERFPSAADDE